MDLEITKYVDSGNLDKERIIFSVKTDTPLGSYAVFKSKKISDNSVSNKVDLVYWFPDSNLKAKDLVVLYSKVGKTNTKLNNDGTTSHFFYWQQDKSIWNEPDNVAVVINISDWSHKSNN